MKFNDHVLKVSFKILDKLGCNLKIFKQLKDNKYFDRSY